MLFGIGQKIESTSTTSIESSDSIAWGKIRYSHAKEWKWIKYIHLIFEI